MFLIKKNKKVSNVYLKYTGVFVLFVQDELEFRLRFPNPGRNATFGKQVNQIQIKEILR